MGKAIKKIKHALFLFFCAAYFLVRGRASKGIKEPKSVLVAQLAKMGDMVCTTPVFRAIKNRYPQCRVYVLGDAANEKLLEGNSDIDGYFVYKKNFFKTLRFFRKKRFDFACLTGPDPEILSMLYLSGIPSIAATVVTGGFSPQQSHISDLLKYFTFTVPRRVGQYVPREYLRLLEPIGIFTDKTEKHLAYSKNADARARSFFTSHNIHIGRDFIVGIAPGTGVNRVKLWGRDKFAKVADHLYKTHRAKIIILGAQSDEHEVKEMLSFIEPGTSVINTCSMFDIDASKALISYLSFYISVDTGPVYIAEAFKVPTIDIVGPVDEREQPPIGERHVVVTPPFREKPETSVMGSRFQNIAEAKRQSDAITAEMVIDAADQLITKLKLSNLS